MPRSARNLGDECVYHVLNRGNAQRTVFGNPEDYAQFRTLLEAAKERYAVSLFSYCLMPNHFHLVVRPHHGADLSRFMHWVLTSHVRRHHTRHETSGHLWQGRYKSFLVQADEHLLMVMRYVERNPIRSGLVSNAAHWLWSSHQETIGIDATGLTDPSPIDLPQPWAAYVDRPLMEHELARIRQSIRRQIPYQD